VIPDGEYTAVLDRIEDGLATLVFETDGTDADELVVDPAAVPSEGRHADAVLTIEIKEEEIVAVTYKASETEERRERAQRRFDRLSRRPPSDDDS